MYNLKNECVSISFNENGGLIGFVDLSTGRDYIEKNYTHTGLFRMSLTEFDGMNIEPGEIQMTSLLAEEFFCSIVKNGLVFTYHSIDNLNIDAVCEVNLYPNSIIAEFKINITNRTNYAIKSVQYPLIHCVMQLGDNPDNDRILLPLLDGCLLPNPKSKSWEGCTLKRLSNQRYFYPGEGREFAEGISAQFMAYYDPKGGLYIATYDSKGNIKELGPIWIQGEDKFPCLDFSPVHRNEEMIGNSFLCDYKTVVGVFHGDWHDAADIYKKWAEKQPWCCRTIGDREDIPNWIKQGAFFFNFRLRFQENGEHFLKNVPDYLSKWKKTLGVPIVAMMSAWEKIGEWTGPDYFPPYGGDIQFKKMSEELQKIGIRVFPFGLSGMKLPIRKKIGRDFSEPYLSIDYNNREFFREHQQESACVLPGNCLILDSEVESWDGLHGYACISTKLAHDMLYGSGITLARDYLVDVVQADQVINGASVECYNPIHGHALGRGSWQIEFLKDIYNKLRRDGKKCNMNFALSQEHTSELFIQSLDIYHGRNYDEPRGLEGIPLFSYLYHEYLPCYGGDWTSFLPENTSGVHFHGHNFVFGNLPAGCPLTMRSMFRNSQPEEADCSILEMAKNASMLFVRFTKYLVMGRMLCCKLLDVSEITVSFFGMEFSGWHKQPIKKPSVLHCLWRSPGNEIALALANISDSIQKFYLDQSSLYGKTKYMLYINDSPAVPMNVTDMIVLSPRAAAIAEFE